MYKNELFIRNIDNQLQTIDRELKKIETSKSSSCSSFAKNMKDCLSYINVKTTKLEEQYLQCSAKAKNKKKVKHCMRQNISALKKFIDNQNRLCKFPNCSEHNLSPDLIKCIEKAKTKKTASNCFVDKYVKPIKLADEKAKVATKKMEKVLSKIKKQH